MVKMLLTWSIVFCIAVVAYADPKWVPTTFITDGVIKTGPATIIDGSIYYAGVTAGNKIELKNGTTSSGTVVYTFIAPAAAGTYQLPQYTKTLKVDQGIYFDTTISGGVIGLELFYQ